jgi:UDP-N-acetylmuramate dehydrogenase
MVKEMEIKKNIQLKEHSTFRIGGPAKFFCEAGTIDELREALAWAKEKNERTYVLGGGSNALFMDNGFDGLVIKIFNKQLEMKDKETILVGAGVVLMELVNFSVENELTGLEWAAGIPGLVGGALRGNAGAFNGEMKECVTKVRAIRIVDGSTADLELEEYNHAQCEFEYRNSLFKKQEGYVVWNCEIELGGGDVEKSKELIKDILDKRKQKQPQLGEFPSLGSVFKNPIVNEDLRKQFEEDKNIQCRADKVPAGWLIEQCDLKEKRVGDAMVSPLQANFIVNMGEARAEDVLILISLIKMKVRNEQGVQLEEEIQIVL